VLAPARCGLFKSGTVESTKHPRFVPRLAAGRRDVYALLVRAARKTRVADSAMAFKTKV
jgi:hypothetical protein